MNVWVAAVYFFIIHTSGISGRKLQFTAVNVHCASCVQSPRRSRATVICLCSMLMCCYISEQRWMQLIDCDTAINSSCNRSVLESKLGTDRRRWMCKGCRRPRVFCPHSGNAFIPTVAFPFVSYTCARSPHHSRPRAPPTSCLLAPSSPFVLEQTALSSSDIKGSRSKRRLSISPAGGRCRRTDWMMSVFVPCHGNKMWHISSSSRSPCMTLYEITVLTGQIVVYGQALEFQEIMEGVLFTTAGQKIIGEWWSLQR